MSTTSATFKKSDRAAYAARFLRSIGDYSHASASMRGTVTSVKLVAGMKSPIVKVAWDNAPADPDAGALACNLVHVTGLAAEAAG